MDSNTARPKHKHAYLYLCLVILAVLAVSFIVFLIIQSKNTQLISSYEECIRANDTTTSKTYPASCKTKDNVSFVQIIKAPVNTNEWIEFDKVSGISLLCPPSWLCEKVGDYIGISQNHYLNINQFSLLLLTPENFQKSYVRNSNYKTPVDWYNAVKEKNQESIIPPQNSKISTPEAGLVNPLYSDYNLNTLEPIKTSEYEGVVATTTTTGVKNVLIPVNESDLLYIVLDFGYLYDDPLIKAVINSVKVNK